MQLENRFTVPVPIDQAWHVLTDIEQVAPCMPGAALDSVNGDEFTGRVKVKLGPINLTYQGHASFLEKDPSAYRAVIDARGKDQRGNGTAAATVTANLRAEGDSTVVDVVTDLNITGRPAQFGRGVMTDVGNKLLGQFADKLAAQLSAGGPAGAAGTAEPAAPQPAAAPAGAAAAAVAGAAEEIAASAEQLQGEGAAAKAVKKTAAAGKKAAATAADKVEPAKAQPEKAAPAKAAPAKAGPAKAQPEKAVAKKAAADILPAEEPAATPAKAAAEAMAEVPPARQAPSGPPSGTSAPPARPATGAPPTAAPGEAARAAAEPAAPPRLRAAAEPEPIDLLEVAGGAAMARLAVPLLGAIGLLLIIWIIRHRSR